MQKPSQKSASNTKASAKANLSRVIGDPRNSLDAELVEGWFLSAKQSKDGS
jgi:hypothetical protein